MRPFAECAHGPSCHLANWDDGDLGGATASSLLSQLWQLCAAAVKVGNVVMMRRRERKTLQAAGEAPFILSIFLSSLSSLGMTVVVVWRIRDPLDNIIRCISACLSALRAEARAQGILVNKVPTNCCDTVHSAQLSPFAAAARLKPVSSESVLTLLPPVAGAASPRSRSANKARPERADKEP